MLNQWYCFNVRKQNPRKILDNAIEPIRDGKKRVLNPSYSIREMYFLEACPD